MSLSTIASTNGGGRKSAGQHGGLGARRCEDHPGQAVGPTQELQGPFGVKTKGPTKGSSECAAGCLLEKKHFRKKTQKFR
jgi:hypothetical protein